MLRIKILSPGKNKERWLEEALNEYIKRLKPFVHVECLWAKNTKQLMEWTEKEPHYLCLDPTGRLFTSEEFAEFLTNQWKERNSVVIFIIGGPEGLPASMKQSAPLISLSPLTFTHQMTRLILIEQIYRTIEIQKSSPYHKS
jgi:23S rRNA (pseudouridine1915-N3)-methyltransferase